jgi:hypothetical protein
VGCKGASLNSFIDATLFDTKSNLTALPEVTATKPLALFPAEYKVLALLRKGCAYGPVTAVTARS